MWESQYQKHGLDIILQNDYKRHNSFHPLEVVGRGSETQLQVGENLIMQNIFQC